MRFSLSRIYSNFSSMKRIEVVAAIIKSEHKVLCVQRPKHSKRYISLKWEFPGGKIKCGETKEEALKREIKEELTLDIGEIQYRLTVDHSYPDFHLNMHVFSCSVSSGVIFLNEHVAMKWTTIGDLTQLDWAAADIPVMEFLQTSF